MSYLLHVTLLQCYTTAPAQPPTTDVGCTFGLVKSEAMLWIMSRIHGVVIYTVVLCFFFPT